MNKTTLAVDDLIEETRLRELDDDQIEWRVRKFTEICEREIESGVKNLRKRKMLIERLQIMKCLYDHSSVKHTTRGSSAREEDQALRNRRVQGIVRRRRMALDMIERVDPAVAESIRQNLDRAFSAVRPAGLLGSGASQSGPFAPTTAAGLHPHHWYFLYFNLFLLAFLITTILLVVD